MKFESIVNMVGSLEVTRLVLKVHYVARYLILLIIRLGY